jgi:hypothetical protein
VFGGNIIIGQFPNISSLDLFPSSLSNIFTQNINSQACFGTEKKVYGIVQGVICVSKSLFGFDLG